MDRKRVLQSIIGLLIAGALFWFAARSVDWQSLWDALGQANIVWVIVSWLFILGGTALKGLRWKSLYTADIAPRWNDLTAFLIIGQFLNAVVPLRFGELSQAYLASKSSQTPLGANLSLVVVLKFMDALAVLGSTLVLGFVLALPDWFRTASWAFIGVFAIIFIVLALVLWLRKPLTKFANRLPQRLGHLLSTGLDGLSMLLDSGRLLPALGLTALIWLTSFATEYTLFYGLNIPATAAGALLIIVSHYISALIPGVPAQVGVFHYVTVLCLGLFGVSDTTGMSYALVLHALIYGTILILGALAVWLKSIDISALWKLGQKAPEEKQT